MNIFPIITYNNYSQACGTMVLVQWPVMVK